MYLGYAAGVGKTYQMLLEGHRLKAEGIDVVVGLVETHGRADTARLLEGLEVVPRRRQEYRGIIVEEMDVDAVLRASPRWPSSTSWPTPTFPAREHEALPGRPGRPGRRDPRHHDPERAAPGEPLRHRGEGLGVKVRERLPERVLAEADEIVNVDLSTEDLQKRLKEGKVYPAERDPDGPGQLLHRVEPGQLRELTLRELASQIDLRRREAPEDEASAAPDQVMVCLSSQGPNSEMLLRYASRLAGRLNRNWYAVYVQTPSEEATVIDAPPSA